MNLTTDAWIPIVWTGGQPGHVGLREAFGRGEEIRDLAVRPHERIALMRLLICIAQAALNGPADHEDWKACRLRIAPSALDYLRRWQHAFELFGNGPRFLQVTRLERPAKCSKSDDDAGNAISKLDVALATGNNTTLFDNAGGSDRSFTCGNLALMLTAFQCFSPGGRIGVALWQGEETTGNGSSEHAPCLAGGMVHALVRGDDLLGSLHRNFMTRQQSERFYGPDSWGKPIWEMMPRGAADAEAMRNANRTYLGRMVPLARAVWLEDGGRSLILSNGVQYGSYDKNGWREPSATVVVQTIKDQPVRRVLRADVEKALWRELHALTVKAVGDKPGGPAALGNIPDDEPFDLWVGGLAADQAKPVDTLESVFHVPARMLHDGGQKVYEGGVKYSVQAERRLGRALSAYRMALETGEKDLNGIIRRLASLRKAERDRLRQLGARAQQQFWTEVELAVPRLLEVAENPQLLGLGGDWYKTGWGKAVACAMRAAFEHSCPHETPRQMRAYALASASLFTESAPEKLEAEEEIGA